MAKLKPCPFCGGQARMKHGKYNLLGAYGTEETARYWSGVFCIACGVEQPIRRYSTKEQAIEAWNRRYAEPKEIDFDYEAEDD